MEPQAPPPAARILVADDDGPFRQLAAIVLKGAGYRVEEARDGREALKLVREQPYDLVLLDIRMPGKSGWEVLREVRDALPEGVPPPRTLMMTGLTTEFDLDRLHREGAMGMLIKPFQNDDLLAEVRRILALQPGQRS